VKRGKEVIQSTRPRGQQVQMDANKVHTVGVSQVQRRRVDHLGERVFPKTFLTLYFSNMTPTMIESQSVSLKRRSKKVGVANREEKPRGSEKSFINQNTQKGIV